MPQAIHISPIDNVVVALHPIAKGTLVEVDGLSVTALEDIPQGHKMAVKPIKNGENVIKYGFPIGHATADAAPGSWMHTHNVHTNLSGEVESPIPSAAARPATTMHRPASCWLRWCATPMLPPFWCCIWAARTCSTISSWKSWASTTTTV